MKNPFHVQPSLRRAVRFSLVIEAIVLLLAALVADEGQAWQICYCAFLGFSVVQFFVLLRRPGIPTKLDLIVIRGGFVPTILLANMVAGYVWNLRGF